MIRLKSLYLTSFCAILVMGISSSWADDQRTYGDRSISTETSAYDNDSYVKVGHRGRRNTALAVGAIVLGTMLYNQNRRQQRNYRGNYYGDSHVNWCYNRYRSYRAYDNTFQPYLGPRRQCVSPYY